MILYYRTVTFLPKIKNNEALVGHCLKVLHGICTKYTINTIGVSFPEWRKETIGDKISFISPNQLELDFLLQQTYFSEMTGLGYFNISDSTLAPEQCNRAVFRRNQKIDQATPNGQRIRAERLAKRAMNRGDSPIRFIPKDLVFEHYHSIPITSTRSGKSFRLNLQYQQLDTVPDGQWAFSSYGLANQKLKSSPVPVI
ncbi:type I-F CRISPR-associated endoribonuclease Cas6/Csy4 [Vibrio parahaemolyticus]|nr:type I-F CRISPR-associated endoribonuclease Cas6/Csy4 [Vibrio parahaemolyticus]